jgi:hypothetical protein
VNRRFEWTYYLCPHGRRISQARKKLSRKAVGKAHINIRCRCFLLASCFIGLLDPEDGGSKFLRNDDKFISEYTASHSRRQMCFTAVTPSSSSHFASFGCYSKLRLLHSVTVVPGNERVLQVVESKHIQLLNTFIVSTFCIDNYSLMSEISENCALD